MDTERIRSICIAVIRAENPAWELDELLNLALHELIAMADAYCQQ